VAAVHIVVMFTDLVGSTELLSRLDPADAEALRQAHFATLRRAVAAHGGDEIKNLGDGLMVTFRSASAALACAVAMQQGLDTHNRSAKEPLSVRIGLSAGEAVVEDGDCFGDPVVEAARLCDSAQGGQILASDLVRANAGRRAPQTFVSVGEMPLKGLPEPVPTVEVKWERLGRGAPIPLPRRLETRPVVGFFGRAAEVGLLRDTFKATTAGEGRRVVLLAGEPGMGKTTLCGEFTRGVHEEGGIVLYGRSDEELAAPYQPFAEALDHLVTHAPAELLTAHVAEHGGELAALVPGLSRRLEDVPPAASGDQETQRFRLFAAVVGLLAAASAENPVVMVLDDLHWADRPTLTLLRYVVGSSAPTRLLLLGTYRQHELTKSHPLTETMAALHREVGVTRLPLTGLDDVDVMAFMESGAGQELTGNLIDLAHALRRETDGNPFFVGQLLRHLVEGGWLFQDDTGQWRARGDLADLTLPETVREVVGHRVARLGDAADRLLSTAAVIGRDFDIDVLGPVAGLPEPDMVELLDRATAAGLLADIGPGRYTFAHAVIQHALYEGLSATRRALLHRRVAETLESLYGAGPGPRVGEVARHWFAATRPAEPGRALDYARWAGEAALAALAPEEAVRWFSQALELLNQQPVPDAKLRADLLIGLGSAQRLAGDPAHRETLLAAAHLAERLGEVELLVRAALTNNRGLHSSSGVVDQERVAVLEAALAAGSGDSPERARLLAILAVELTFAGDWLHRRRLADDALAMARRLDDPATFVRVAGLLYFCILVPETLHERLTMTAEVLTLADEQGDPLVLHFAHRWRLYTVANAADLVGIDAHLPEMMRYGHACRDPHNAWIALIGQAWRSLLAGDLEHAEALTLEGFRFGTDTAQPEAMASLALQLFEIRRQQDRLAEIEETFAGAVRQYPGLPAFRAVLAVVYSELGEGEKAEELFSIDAVDGFATVPYDWLWLYGLVHDAEVCAAHRASGPALALYDRLAPWHAQLPTIPPVTNAGAVALYLGMLATVLDRFDDAETHFAEASEIHERLQAPYWIARTQLERARMLLARRGPDDSSRAAVLLDEVEATAHEYGFAALTRHAAGLRL
jgi:class 3 adenylate cyclase/tetratricopeptide (TPR) repeat protein